MSDKKIVQKFLSTRALFGRLAREHLLHYKGVLAFAVLMMVLQAACTAGFAKLIEPILDKVFIAKNESALWPIAAAVFAVFTIRGIATYGEAMLMSRVGQGIIRDLQNKLFRHVVRADLAFFHESQIGALVSRFTFDISMLRYAVSNTITSMGKDLLTLVFLIGLLFYQDPWLAAISVIVFPLTAIPIDRLGRKMRRIATNAQGATGFYSAMLEQVFHGMRHLKANNTEQAEVARAEGMTQHLYRLSQKAQKFRSISSPIMEVFGAVAICVVIVYGGYQVIHGEKTAGSFFSFITALLLAYDPLKGIAKLNAGLQEGLAAAQRVFDLLAMEPTIVDRPDAKPLALQQGKIEFERVSFSYQNGKEALRDLSLTVPAGKKLALVGASGGGKTTILNLIPRFYDVDQGAIRIDGQDVRDVTLTSLRDTMALVSQETLLFDDTIRSNIAYGQKDAGEAAIIEAAKSAGAHEFIISLPDGYDTMVGPQGAKLSGGQRQRIAIARAMLKNAPILLLDEATSALDSQTEKQVQTALNALMQGRTTIIIAHRLSTVIDADVICVIEDGRLAEQGTHAELLKKGGLYAGLYQLQYHNAPSAQPALSLASSS